MCVCGWICDCIQRTMPTFFSFYVDPYNTHIQLYMKKCHHFQYFMHIFCSFIPISSCEIRLVSMACATFQPN